MIYSIYGYKRLMFLRKCALKLADFPKSEAVIIFLMFPSVQVAIFWTLIVMDVNLWI